MKKHPPVALTLGSVFCLGLGAIDILTGNEFNLSILFLIPILWIAWLLGNPSGYCLAVLCIFIWGISDKLAGHIFSSQLSYGWNTTMRFGIFVIGAYFAEALATALKREQEFARRDFLTGSYNSKAFYEFLELEAYRCRRHNRPLTIAYIDCDDFKTVNDRLGHHRGDELLKLVGDMLRRGLRLTDVCARLGGDEFVVILPETKNHDARNVFLRLRKNLSETAMVKELKVTFSVGIVTYLKPLADLDQMVRKADELMYEAKKNDQNKVNAQEIGWSI